MVLKMLVNHGVTLLPPNWNVMVDKKQLTKIRTELFDQERLDAICDVTDIVVSMVESLGIQMKQWQSSFAEVVPAELLKRFRELDISSLKLKTYCTSVQCCNEIMTVLPAMDDAEKKKAYVSFISKVQTHRVTLDKNLIVWLKNVAKVTD